MPNKAHWKVFKDEIVPLLSDDGRKRVSDRYKGYKKLFEHYKSSKYSLESYVIFLETGL